MATFSPPAPDELIAGRGFTPPSPTDLVSEFTPPNPGDLIEPAAATATTPAPSPNLVTGPTIQELRDGGILAPLTSKTASAPLDPTKVPLRTTIGGEPQPMFTYGTSPTERQEKFSRELVAPIVPIPKFTVNPDDTKTVSVGKSIVNFLSGMVEFAESPAGILTAPVAGVAPKAVASFFTFDMAKSLGEQATAAGVDWDKMTDAQKAAAVTDMSATGLLATALGSGVGVKVAREARVGWETAQKFADTKAPIGPDFDVDAFNELNQLAPQTAKAVSETIKSTEAPSADQISKTMEVAGDTRATPVAQMAEGKATEVQPTSETIPSKEQVGLGAAVPSEFEPARKFTTETTVEQINKERKERGLEPLEEHEVFGNKQAVSEAKRILDENPDAAEQILERLREKPETSLEPTERAVMVIHRAELLNSYYRALKNWREHFEGGDIARAAQEAEVAEFYSKKLSESESLVSERGAGTAAGRALQAIKIGITEDYSLDMMTLRAMKAKGETLTPEEGSAIVKEHEVLKDRIKKLEEELAKEREIDTAADAQTAVDEAVDAATKRKKSTKSKGEERDLESEHKEAVDHLKETFIENGDVSGEATTIRKLMELLVEREGITERLKMEDRVHEILSKEVDPTITRKQAMDLMSNYGKSRLPSPEFAKKTVRDIAAQILSVRKLLDYFQGERPKLTGQLRDAPSDIQRGLIKMVNEAKKAFKLEGPTDNARAVKSAIDAINTRLKNRIADLKQEIATRQKIIRERNPSPYNAETLRMREEVAELEKAHKEIFGKPEMTPEQRLALLEKSTERQIAELERQLKTGEIFPKSKIPFTGESPKLLAARARLEELKQTREFAREAAQPKIEATERFLLNYLLRLRQREVEYRERIATGDFAKRTKPQRELSPDILRAKAEVESAKQDFHKSVMEFELARRTKLRKIWDGIKQTKNAFVNIVSSYDLSAPRQMFLALMANATRVVTSPKEGAKLIAVPLGRMVAALSNERRSQALEQWRKSRPNATSGADKIAEIQYTELHTTDFTRWEENAHSVLDNWAQLPIRTGSATKTAATLLPKLGAKGVRASNRAFITALNTQRATLFDHLLDTNFRDRAPTEADLKVIGNLVNVSTGRGKLSRGVAKVTGEVLWSPSLLASRVQALTGQPLWGGGPISGSARARLIVAREYARWIISGTALAAIAYQFDDKNEGNSTSSDFGKIVRGKTRIDVWAGFQQLVVLASRIQSGKKKSSDTGKISNISTFGTGEAIWTFFKNKVRPDIAAIVRGTIAAIDSGKPSKDVRVTVGEAVKSSVPVPLAVQDVISIMKDRGMSEGAIIEALSLFGVGINTYDDKEKQK